MRKETKKLKHPNVIIDSLEKPVYASTDISYSCNVNGPNCTEEPISEDDYWKSGWKDANDFGHTYGDCYDFHICPNCQENSCMKCFDGVINKDNSQCSNKNCENHTYCKECGEEFFTHPYGDDYCINPDCENSGGDTTPKLATKNYWIQCDGPGHNSAKYQDQNGNWNHVKIDEASDEIKNNPTYERYCDSDGWDPEYDRMPEGWHRDEHDRNGDHSTDYCKDCWENSICHECKEPYTDGEVKFDYHQVCKNPSCDIFNNCKHCHGDINEFGNCDRPEDGYGDCWTCRHCNRDLDKRGNCLNTRCEAFKNPLTEAFFGKEAHYEHRDMHPDDFGYDPNSDENYHIFQVCDGCGLEDNTGNVISRTKWHYPDNGEWTEDHTFNGMTMHHLVQNHLCDDCWNSGNYCDDCGEELRENNTCANYEHCPTSHICPECHGELTQHGQCKDPDCEQFINPYKNFLSDPS